jgi:hypothetical protein
MQVQVAQNMFMAFMVTKRVDFLDLEDGDILLSLKVIDSRNIDSHQ